MKIFQEFLVNRLIVEERDSLNGKIYLIKLPFRRHLCFLAESIIFDYIFEPEFSIILIFIFFANSLLSLSLKSYFLIMLRLTNHCVLLISLIFGNSKEFVISNMLKENRFIYVGVVDKKEKSPIKL